MCFSVHILRSLREEKNRMISARTARTGGAGSSEKNLEVVKLVQK